MAAVWLPGPDTAMLPVTAVSRGFVIVEEGFNTEGTFFWGWATEMLVTAGTVEDEV